VPLWIDHKRGEKWFYKINRQHPLIEKIKAEANKKPERAIETLIRFIEETIPIKSIYIKEAESSETQGRPFEGVNHDDLIIIMKGIFNSLLTDGKSKEEARAIIINLEPFNHYPEYISNLENL
jgi:hypothetical protein